MQQPEKGWHQMSGEEIVQIFINQLKEMSTNEVINRGVSRLSLTPETHLYELYLDSLDKMALLAAIDAEFDAAIEADAIDDMDTLLDIAIKISRLKSSQALPT